MIRVISGPCRLETKSFVQGPSVHEDAPHYRISRLNPTNQLYLMTDHTRCIHVRKWQLHETFIPIVLEFFLNGKLRAAN